MSTPFWSPAKDHLARHSMDHLCKLATSHGARSCSYEDVWQWSVDRPGDFWSLLAEDAGIVWQKKPNLTPGTPTQSVLQILDPSEPMLSARFFEGFGFNYAEQIWHKWCDQLEREMVCAYEDGVFVERLSGRDVWQRVCAIA